MPSLRFLSVTEPHPSVPKQGAYLGGGRGGAGNFKKYSAGEITHGASASGPAARLPLTKQPNRTVAIGRGGAGNMGIIPDCEEGVFQLDEDLVKVRTPEVPVYRIGRGGAGNMFVHPPSRKEASSIRKTSSESSASDWDSLSANSFSAIRRHSPLGLFTRRAC